MGTLPGLEDEVDVEMVAVGDAACSFVAVVPDVQPERHLRRDTLQEERICQREETPRQQPQLQDATPESPAPVDSRSDRSLQTTKTTVCLRPPPPRKGSPAPLLDDIVADPSCQTPPSPLSSPVNERERWTASRH
nr:hypothetical protein KRP22_8202 [Phytophthora ramorum]